MVHPMQQVINNRPDEQSGPAAYAEVQHLSGCTQTLPVCAVWYDDQGQEKVISATTGNEYRALRVWEVQA